jgi:hypothetical protein
MMQWTKPLCCATVHVQASAVSLLSSASGWGNATSATLTLGAGSFDTASSVAVFSVPSSGLSLSIVGQGAGITVLNGGAVNASMEARELLALN